MFTLKHCFKSIDLNEHSIEELCSFIGYKNNMRLLLMIYNRVNCHQCFSYYKESLFWENKIGHPCRWASTINSDDGLTAHGCPTNFFLPVVKSGLRNTHLSANFPDAGAGFGRFRPVSVQTQSVLRYNGSFSWQCASQWDGRKSLARYCFQGEDQLCGLLTI